LTPLIDRIELVDAERMQRLIALAQLRIVGIEIFDATKRLPIQSLLRLKIAGKTR
jgi:hypothetical protein